MAALAARAAEKIAPKVKRFFPFVALGMVVLTFEKITDGVE